MADNEASSVYSLQSLSHAQILNANNENNNNNHNSNSSISTSRDSQDFSLHYIKHKHQLINILNEKNLHSHLDYKSGAVYDGKIEDNLKCGQGAFVWPNGDKYSGDFVDNHRHGFGTQHWNDGSVYEGQFLRDKRNGHGCHKWASNENYEGNWFHDFRHGYGKYQWYDSNVYFGMFFMNNREGYGHLMYSSGDDFKGLYKKDNRYGPGILKYPDNSEDIGFWNGDKLVRLLVSIQNVDFKFDDFEPINKNIELKSWYSRDLLLHDTLNPPNIFVNKHINAKENNFIKDDPYVEKVLQNKTIFYDEFIRSFERYLKINNNNSDTEINEKYKQNKTIQVLNISPSLLDIFKHFNRFAHFEENLSKALSGFDLKGFKNSNRDVYLASAGILEQSSIQFLNACCERNIDKLKQFKNLVDIDVCDNRGYSPLIIAVFKCDTKIINYLLDNGANINHLLDNGLSALMICIIRYYTGDKFLPNTALSHQDLQVTRKMTPNSNVVQQQTQSDEDLQVKQIISQTKLENIEDEETAFEKLDVISDHLPIGLAHLQGDNGSTSLTKTSDFESIRSLKKYKIEFNENLANKYVDLKSKSKFDNASFRMEDQSTGAGGGKLFKKTTQLQLLNEVSHIIELLLRRGADPSLSCLPYPALCFAVAAGDIKIVKMLLEKGADVNRRMPRKYYSLTPLCLACGSLGELGPELVQLLLDSLADPNASSDIGPEYMSMCEEGWENDILSDELNGLVMGRTPLHIAAARNDIYAVRVVKQLLEHHANPNVICNGQSPLSLAIAAGNKETIDLLLKSNLCDPNLPLTNGIGSVLCLISSTLYEHKWTPSERIKLIEKLMHYGADILQPIAFGPRRLVGTVVDYANYMYNSDMRLAHTPYHSLTINERNTLNARRTLLDHLGKRFREKAIEKAHIVETGLSYQTSTFKSWGPAVRKKQTIDDTVGLSDSEGISRNDSKKLSKWCYYCGKSVGIKLTPCSRCKKVFYCSNNCKQRAWNEIHKSECVLHQSTQSRGQSAKSISSSNPNGDAPTTDKHHLLLAKRMQTSHQLTMKNTMNKKLIAKLDFSSSKNTKHNSSHLSINPLFNELDNYSYN